MKRLHLIAGIAALLVFALSGQYMHHVLELSAEEEFTSRRMMYRASHIYLLWAGAVNVLLGCYWAPFEGRYAQPAQWFGSALILVSPFVLLAAFWLEPPVTDMDGALTFLGCVALLAGTGLTLLSACLTARRRTGA